MGAERPAENWLVQIYLAIPDFEVVATIRIGAYPCFIVDCCSLATEIGEGYQHTTAALLTFGERNIFQEFHLPSKKIYQSYTKNALLARGTQLEPRKLLDIMSLF